MNNKLVEEIDDVLHDLDHGNITRGEAKSKLLLAIAAKVEEPLAVLADRKGYYIENILTPDFNHGWGEIKEWDLRIGKVKGNDWEQFKAPTYALAEAKARAYLEGLPDVKGEKK